MFEHRRSLNSMRRQYNLIHPLYGLVERHLGPKIDTIIQEKIAKINNVSSSTALEYACGSGLLTLKLAPLFRSVTGRDISFGMLQRAQRRAAKRNLTATFTEGNILAIDESDKSYDFVFVSFGMHLFSPEVEKQIIEKLCRVARKSVFIIDHGKKWELGMAVIEWLEGSHYDQYLEIDFSKVAKEIGCRGFEESSIQGCAVLEFICDEETVSL